MAKKPPSERNYEIGKGRPPKKARWKPGQSGNPKGRPKGSRNAATMAKAELNRKVPATVNGRKRKMSVEEISYRRLGEKAMNGDQKALGFLLMLANNIDPTDVKSAEDTPTSEQDLAIIANYLARQKRKRGEQ